MTDKEMLERFKTIVEYAMNDIVFKTEELYYLGKAVDRYFYMRANYDFDSNGEAEL